MGAAREKTQADFDLERFIDMFDAALTSDDPRVKNALQSLMMMTILTANDAPNVKNGPLRQLYDDVRAINRRLSRVEEDAHYNQVRAQGTVGAWPSKAEATYAMKASGLMAQQIDQDVLLKASAMSKIQGLK
jgi:hypothetical protein